MSPYYIGLMFGCIIGLSLIICGILIQLRVELLKINETLITAIKEMLQCSHDIRKEIIRK